MAARQRLSITSSRPRSARFPRPDLRKASGFPATPAPFVLLRALRRLTDCAEKVIQARCPSERQSLSANQAAEPQLIANGNDRNMDKPGRPRRLRYLPALR